MNKSYKDLKSRMYISPDKFNSMISDLAIKIKRENYTPDIIVVVERAGFAMIRPLLDIFVDVDYDTCRIKYYKGVGEKSDKPEIITRLRDENRVSGKKILAIEECTDTGKTSQLLKNYLE